MKTIHQTLLVLCLAGMGLGLFFWRGKGALSARQTNFFSGLLALTGLILVGLFSIVIGSWLLGLASLILVLLISIALASRFWMEV